MKTNDDPRIRLMSRGAFPLLDGMNSDQVELHRARWIKAVEYLGENWRILQQHQRPEKGVILLPFKKEA